MKYTPLWSRLFLFLDEWIGIAVLLWAWHLRDMYLLAVFGIPWAVAIYAIGYLMQWAFEKRAEEEDHG